MTDWRGDGGRRLPPTWRVPAAVAVAALVVVGVGTGYLVTRDDDKPRTEVLGEALTSPTTTALAAPQVPPATTTSVSPATTAVASTPTTRSTATTRARATTTARPPTTTTPQSTAGSTLACRDSRDPACGPLRWDTGAFVNRALKLEAEWSPGPALVGQVVTFTLTASDPDAGGPGPSESILFGDGSGQATVPAAEPCDRFGTWSLPASSPGRWVRKYTHAYDGPGIFEASFSLTSATPGLPLGCRDDSIDVGDPWASTATLKVAVTVVSPA